MISEKRSTSSNLTLTESGGGSRHATVLWLFGLGQVLVFGCFSGIFGAIALAGPAVWQDQALPPGMSVSEIQAVARAFVVVLLLVMVLPGALLIVLGFLVRRGNAVAHRAGQAVLSVQAVLMTLYGLISLVALFAQGMAAQALVPLLVLGGLAALHFWGVSLLRRPLPARDVLDDNWEPWNQHLPRS